MNILNDIVTGLNFVYEIFSCIFWACVVLFGAWYIVLFRCKGNIQKARDLFYDTFDNDEDLDINSKTWCKKLIDICLGYF